MAKKPTKAQADEIGKAYEDAITEVVANNKDPETLNAELQAKIDELNGGRKPDLSDTTTLGGKFGMVLGSVELIVDTYLEDGKPVGYATLSEIEGPDVRPNLFDEPGTTHQTTGAKIEGGAGQAAAGDTKAPEVAAEKPNPHAARREPARSPAPEEARFQTAVAPEGYVERITDGIETLIAPYAGALQRYEDGEITSAELSDEIAAASGEIDAAPKSLASIALQADGKRGVVQVVITPTTVKGRTFASARVFGI